MAVLEVGQDRRQKRLDDLGLVEAAEEPERDAADELIRVLEVVAEVLANEDHFGKNFSLGIGFLNELEVEQEEFLDGVVLGREDIADDGDEELRDGLAVEQEHDRLLEGFDFGFDVVSFQGFFDLVGQCWGCFVEVDEESARFFHFFCWVGIGIPICWELDLCGKLVFLCRERLESSIT